METELNRVYTWKIDMDYERGHEMQSDNFSSGGYEWYILTNTNLSYMSVSLLVSNADSLEIGWKIKAKYYLIVYDETGKELCRSPQVTSYDLCKEDYSSDLPNVFPLFKLRGKLTMEVYMNVFEGKYAEVDCYGFTVLASQVKAVSQIFMEHPDIISVEDFRPKNHELKTAYVYVLLGLVETLNKPPESLSGIDLSNAHRNLSELTEAGFKLDWLVTKLEDAKKINSQTPQTPNLLLDRIKNLKLTLSHLKDELQKMESAADKKV